LIVALFFLSLVWSAAWLTAIYVSVKRVLKEW